jgi:GAF domain-containing protein
VIVADASTDPTHYRHDLLPNTRSEMALPLLAGGRVIGALDIQSAKPNAFNDTDARIFQTMADHLAITIENARLFERAQRDLLEIEQLNRRLTGGGWREFQMDRPGSAPVGYRTSPDGISPIQASSAAQIETKPGTLSIPLVVRGEPIGMLDVSPRGDQVPDKDVESIIQAVAERVAQALDATRVGEQALRQAEREQVLSRLSAELQAATDLDVILRVAAREAGRSLGAPRGFVHLIMEYGETRDARAD